MVSVKATALSQTLTVVVLHSHPQEELLVQVLQHGSAPIAIAHINRSAPSQVLFSRYNDSISRIFAAVGHELRFGWDSDRERVEFYLDMPIVTTMPAAAIPL